MLGIATDFCFVAVNNLKQPKAASPVKQRWECVDSIFFLSRNVVTMSTMCSNFRSFFFSFWGENVGLVEQSKNAYLFT